MLRIPVGIYMYKHHRRPNKKKQKKSRAKTHLCGGMLRSTAASYIVRMPLTSAKKKKNIIWAKRKKRRRFLQRQTHVVWRIWTMCIQQYTSSIYIRIYSSTMLYCRTGIHQRRPKKNKEEQRKKSRATRAVEVNVCMYTSIMLQL